MADKQTRDCSQRRIGGGREWSSRGFEVGNRGYPGLRILQTNARAAAVRKGSLGAGDETGRKEQPYEDGREDLV